MVLIKSKVDSKSCSSVSVVNFEHIVLQFIQFSLVMTLNR